MRNVIQGFRQLKLSVTLASLLYAVLGFVLLFWPGASGILMCRILGGALLACGLFYLFGYVVHVHDGFQLELVFGVVAAAVGGLFLIFPMAILSILPVIMGLYISVDSLVALRRANELRRMNYDRWWISLVLAIIDLAFGLFLIFKPMKVANTVFRVIGAALLYMGVSDLWSLFKLTSFASALERGIDQEYPTDQE